jgi:TP901 family phage tail tape measure protein
MAGAVNVVRELVARFGIDVDKKSADKADTILDSLISKAKALVAIGAAAQFARWVQSVVEEADKLNDAAERIGTTTAALQGLGYAAKLSGSSAETLEQGLRFLTRTMGQAENGSADAQKAFSDLGVKIRDGNGKLKTADALFLEISDKMAGIENPTKRATLAMGVFSKAGQELAPLLHKGAGAIGEMQAEFVALGGQFDREFVDLSAEYMDNTDRLGAVFKSLGASIGKGVLPHVNKLVNRFVDFWKTNKVVREWVEKVFNTLATGIRYAIQLLDPFIDGALALASAWEDSSNTFKWIMGALVIAASLSWGILAPWVLIGAAIALVVEDLYTFAIGGESVIGTLIDQLFEFATAGDTVFHKFLAGFLSMVVSLRDGGFSGLWDEIKQSLITALEFYKGLFSEFVDWVAFMIAGIGSRIADALRAGVEKAKAFLGISSETPAGSSVADPAGPWFTPTAHAFARPFAPQDITATPRVSAAPITSTNTTQVTVMATPGMDETALANATAEAVAAAMQQEKRDLFDAIIPAVR